MRGSIELAVQHVWILSSLKSDVKVPEQMRHRKARGAMRIEEFTKAKNSSPMMSKS